MIVLDPDPLRPRDTDAIFPSAEYVDGLATVLFLSAANAAPSSPAAGGYEPGNRTVSQPTVQRASARAAHATASEPASITGPATWYDAPTARDAAAGPALRKALGPGWRDSTVSVCAGRCIEVVLSDWCACGHGHVIDLDDQAFARLAPLPQGVVQVRIYVDAGPSRRVSPPPTDVGP